MMVHSGRNGMWIIGKTVRLSMLAIVGCSMVLTAKASSYTLSSSSPSYSHTVFWTKGGGIANAYLLRLHRNNSERDGGAAAEAQHEPQASDGEGTRLGTHGRDVQGLGDDGQEHGRWQGRLQGRRDGQEPREDGGRHRAHLRRVAVIFGRHYNKLFAIDFGMVLVYNTNTYRCF